MCLIEYSIFLLTFVLINGNVINNRVSDEVLYDDAGDDAIDISHLGANLYGAPDAEVGAKVLAWTPDNDVNPEELGSYLQGDLLVNRPLGKNGLTDETTRWPKGIVPFKISGNFSK